METEYARIFEDGWRERKGSLTFSCEEIGLALAKDEVRESFFTVSGSEGEPVEGYVSCQEERATCLTSFFSGTSEQIAYRFDARGMREGEERRGKFLIVSEWGEYEIPFHAVVLHAEVEGLDGPIGSLFQFVALAKENWPEAVKLFYSPSFIRLLGGADRKYRNLYRGLSRYPGQEQNMEEFLVTAQKKPPVEYSFPIRDVVVNAAKDGRKQEQLCETVRIMRTGWGYTRLDVTVEGDFLSVEKQTLREEDFLGNQCSFPVFIRREALHGGKNFGRILFAYAGGKQEIRVCASNVGYRIRSQAGTGEGLQSGGRRQEMKRMTVELVKLYQDMKMKKLGTVAWRARTAEVLDRMRRLDGKAPEVRMYLAHLLITEERYTEAGRILKELEITPKGEGPELYCYYLYLSSLYRQEEGFMSEVILQVEEMHRMYRDSWRIAWLQLFLSPSLRRSASQKWMFLEEQFQRGGTSPVLYLEAVNLVNLAPTLMMKLDTYELQLLHFGARCGILSADLAGHVAYLAEKEKYYRQPLFEVLRSCYEQNPTSEILQAICSLLIKGNKSGPAYYEWYRLGVEQELRVTRLYEYFMMSVDLEKEVEIPRIVLMYFAYQSNLDQDRCAYLYAYLCKHRQEYQELYLSYRGQMERFVLQQLYRGRMSRDLAYLYQNVLEERLLTEDNCRQLAPLLFWQQLDCEDDGIRQAVVVHTRLREEQVYPVENGRAYVAIYDRDYEVFLEDGQKNRTAQTIPFTLTCLIVPGPCVKKLEPHVEGVLGFDLYCCENGRGKIQVTQKNLPRLRYLAQREEILPAFARSIRIALLRYYDAHDQMEEMDMLLEELQKGQMEGALLYETAGYLILRGFYEKAYEWLDGADLDRVDEKVLLRLGSRLLENGLHTDEKRLTCLVCSAYERGKYDSYVLQYLVRNYAGPSEKMLEIREAAENFAVDTYSLTQRILIRLLYVGDDVMKRSGLLKRYLAEGGKAELEAAFLHKCSGLYLMEGEEMDAYVLKDIGRALRCGEKLSDMCALAYLDYYSRHRDERSPEVDQQIQMFGDRLLAENIALPLFQEYADILEGAWALLDKTMVVYKGRQEQPVVIHYRIVRVDGHAKEEMRALEMQHIYAGIYVAGFVLFAGESLQYYITAAGEDGGYLDSGELKMGESGLFARESRYGRLNAILSAWLVGDRSEAQELLEQYRMTEWMAEGIFKPLE